MKLLVVEDEPDLLARLVRVRRREGSAVDPAADGEEALFKARSAEYDAIVLDVMLPRLSGWEVLTRLRETQSTPVLLLTARDGSADRVRGLDSGADDYVVKPFDLPELCARLRALIRRRAGRSTPTLSLRDVRIDTAARTVTLAGEPLTLTAREYVVLEFLALHRGEVVSRTTLHEHLFDENDSTLSNILDVHVFNLRRKLGRDFIQTRRGLGYCIE